MTSNDPHSHQSSHPSMDSTLELGTATRTQSPPPVASSETHTIDEKEPVNSKSGIDTENHPKALEAGVAGNPEPDVIIVGWDGPDDVDNPKNWTKGKKWVVTAVVSSYTFVSPFSSSIVSPAAAVIGEEFNITNSTLLSMVVSVFVLAYAFGPLFLGPLSEIFGRVRVLQIANLFYLVFNIACGLSRNKEQLLAFRFLAGLGGSAPLAIGGGVLGDCWLPENRGQAVAIYSLAPVLGPILGPVVGSWIVEKINWRWVFWATSMTCGCVQILGFITLKESYAPVLLERKAKQIRKDMGLSPDDHRHVRTQYESPDRHWQQIVRTSLTRPFVMFIHEPIIQLLGLYISFLWRVIAKQFSKIQADLRDIGLTYLILVTLPEIYQRHYNQPLGISGLHYLALGLGTVGMSQVNARMLDIVYRHLKAKNGGKGRPEYRLPSMMVGSIILPFGLLLFGWTAQNRVFWIAPDMALLLIGSGVVLVNHSVQSYLIDNFSLYAASAIAAVWCLRSMAGFGFPLYAPAMYKALGYGKGDTILAVFGMAVGWPAPFLFWRYGERLRQRSSYTQKPKPT